ncbi:MAG: class I poly(R)-hydroxyalkanoic acid synthase [Proteobacteria bacterium]|nr:class I poly(R)-hydroxyalkanoic acid synthase [Pseudomonadota bacterium]HQR03013.1 class I poly(R)-hydroxyalkanoic acid synthase [Rhodocyclaceae bacterium]
MSVPPESPSFPQQFFLQASQAFSQAWSRWMASPDSATLIPLQQEWAERYGALWRQALEGQGVHAAEKSSGQAPADRRFSDPAWGESPVHGYLHQLYQLNAEFFSRAAEALPVQGETDRARIRYLVRQIVEAMAPSNFAATNPQFIRHAIETQGESIRTGLQNLLEDMHKGRITMSDESAFEVGRNLAVTPGSVVFENELFQLIQYAPQTGKVGQRPLLMIPPCINKYYILDLQPRNSVVRYVVEQGHTVFLVSWRNPGREQGRLTWEDYIEQGVLQAIEVVRGISGQRQLNMLGFCVGGTLLSCALAVARARGDDPARSLTLLTTLLDFEDAGEIGVFVDEGSVALRETTIGQGGLLPGKELAAMFSSLRANDLIWQYVVGNYLMGGKPRPFDLLYWNADSTNLPGPFLAWYLRHMYLQNELRIPGQLHVGGTPVDLGKLDMPAFILAAREDHIVPWASAYASSCLLQGKTEFVLAASGHIAGVINPAVDNKRSHWQGSAPGIVADDWLEQATEKPGSWWPAWMEWLSPHRGRKVSAPEMPGNEQYPVIEAAPGRYVKEKA